VSKEGKNQSPGGPDADTFEGLSLEDTFGQQARGLGGAVKKKTGHSGYNPYDAGPTGKPRETEKKKPTDLRKLSEWIRLKRDVEALDKERKDPDEKK
jgi:hypothetical protein